MDIVRAVCWDTKEECIPLDFPKKVKQMGNGTVSPGDSITGRDALAYYYCGQDFGSNSGDNGSF